MAGKPPAKKPGTAVGKITNPSPPGTPEKGVPSTTPQRRGKTPPPPPAVQLAKPPKSDPIWVENGVDQNLPFSAPYVDIQGRASGDLYEIVRNWNDGGDDGPSVQQLAAMRRMDGQARALYRLITLPIRAALQGADFLPASDGGGQAEADFIKQVFTLPPAQGGMTVPFSRFMSHLLQAIFDGFSAFEQVFWMPTSGPLKGKVTLKKLAYRPSETITFVADKWGGFEGIRQRAFVNGVYVDSFIPKEQVFYWAAQEEERKFYGVSFFQSAYYHYDKKMKMYLISHLAAQRAAVGTRVGTVPNSATQLDRTRFAESMQNLAVAQYILAPEGFEVDVLKEGGSFDFLNFVNHHNSQMSKSILATFFDEDKGGGSADSKMINFGGSDKDMFTLMLQAIMDDIAQSINHYIIPKLIDYNFGSGKYPTFTWGKITEEQKGAVRDVFNQLATAGQNVNATPEFMRELEKTLTEMLGLQVDYKKVEKREKDAAAQAQDQFGQAQQAAEAGAAAGPQGPNAMDPAEQQFSQSAMALSMDESADDEDFVIWLSSVGPCSLAKTPQKDNWVDNTSPGHLPNYICHIAKALVRSGHPTSEAIAIAVGTVKRWAAKGAAYGDTGHSVTAATQAKAAEAMAEWEKLKAAAHAGHLVKAAAFDGTDEIMWIDGAEPVALSAAELDDDEIVLLTRHVRTPEGQLRFKQPMGSPIVRDPEQTSQDSVAYERLISLYRQYKGYKEAGAHEQAENVRKQLSQAISKFPKTKKNQAALSKLHALVGM